MPDGPPNPGTTPSINLVDDTGNTQELGPLNSNTTKIGVIHNDVPPTLGTTNPNAQVDFRQAWIDIKRDAGKDWVYFAWERDKSTGSGFIAYEFMQNPAPAACDYEYANQAELDDLIANCNPWANRDGDTDGAGPDIGDFFILWDQQGGSRVLQLAIWQGTAPNLTLGTPTPLNAAVSQAEFSEDGFRGEAAVNLTDTIFGGVLSCLAFANTIPSTVTGNSNTADYKDTILETVPPVSSCETTTVTTPQDGDGVAIPADGISIGDGVVAVQDSAEVTLTGGTATPGGSVEFFLCKVAAGELCDTGGTSVGSTDLTGAAYPVTVDSPTAYVTSAGDYCWRGVFSGDTENGIPGSSDSSAGECFTVNPVTPELSTDAGADVFLGNAVTDSAELSGTATQPADPVINLDGTAGAPAGGTITFKLIGPDDCSTVAYESDPDDTPVSGDGTYNSPDPQFVPTAPGDYHWVAVYSGSSPNTDGVTHNADCTDTDEDVVVNTVASSLSTAQSWVPNDSATISAPAGGDLNGTVSFTLFPTSNCSGTPVFTPVEVAVSGASPQTVGTSNTTAVTTPGGSFSWLVSYDSDNAAQEDIPGSCHETSVLTIVDGGTISSPPL